MLGHKLDFPVFPYKYMLRAYLVYQTFEKEMIPIIYNIIQRIEAECILHNSFYEVSISILMSKLKKKNQHYKKLQINILHEHRRKDPQ